MKTLKFFMLLLLRVVRALARNAREKVWALCYRFRFRADRLLRFAVYAERTIRPSKRRMMQRYPETFLFLSNQDWESENVNSGLTGTSNV